MPPLGLPRKSPRRFNFLYKEIFPTPQDALTEFPVLPGTDGRKMSKSYQNTIAISDSPEAIKKKVSIMVTDPARIKREDKGHPEVCPVYAFYKIFAKERKDTVAKECRSAERGCVECKKELAQVLIDYLAPIHAARKDLEADPKILDRVLADGAKRARKVAAQTLIEAKEAVGLA